MMSSQEYMDLVVRDAGEKAKQIIQDAFNQSDNFFEGLARLKIRKEQIYAYNSMSKILRQMQRECKHDFIIIAMEQNWKNEFVYLKECRRCFTRTLWIDDHEL